MIEPAAEVDRKLCWILSGESKKVPPPYSTSPKISRRFLRRLTEMGFQVTFEESGGLWYCVMFTNSERVASGSAQTRELALARAALNCTRWGTPPPENRRPRTFRSPANPNKGIRVTVVCLGCTAEFTTIKSAKVTPLCNICSWRRLTEERTKTRSAWGASINQFIENEEQKGESHGKDNG